MKLIDNWRRELRRLWSIRVAAFWGAVSGLLLIWPALADSIPIWAYAVGGITVSMSFAVARFLKQPGADT